MDINNVYDPTKLLVTFNGERVYGFDSDIKVFISRRLNGMARVRIYLQATSPWVSKLKESLGHPATVETEYPGTGSLSESMQFVSGMFVKGYDVDYTPEVPVFVFFLEAEK